MTDKLHQLESWYNAVKVAFKMGTRHPSGDVALVISIHKRLQQAVTSAKTDEDRKLADTEMKEFLEDLAQACPMYELICKRFNTDLYPQLKVGEDVKIYVALMADSPGSAVSAMTYLFLARCFTVNDMIINFLPNGYPDNQPLGITWGLQKNNSSEGSDNLLDDIETVNSLYNKMYKTGDQ